MDNSLFKYFNVNNLVDWVIVGGVVFSILFGVYRGFIREVLGILLWTGALMIALYWAMPLAERFPEFATSLVRQIIFFVGILIICLLLGTIIRSLIEHSRVVQYFSGVDRVLGFGFGVLRGFAIFLFSIMILAPTTVSQQDQWKSSRLIPVFETLEKSIVGHLPKSWQGWIHSKTTGNRPK